MTWGLVKPDKAEGIRRAMNATLYGPPGVTFKYSDVNFITLGAIVEKMSGETLDVYAARHIFEPLDMTHTRSVSAVRESIRSACRRLRYERSRVDDQVEPKSRDEWTQSESDFDHLLRATVHDPTHAANGWSGGSCWGVFDGGRCCDLCAGSAG